MKPLRKPISSWSTVPTIMDLYYASTLLGRSYTNLKKLAGQNAIPAFKVGREWRIRKDKLLEFIEQQENR